MSRITLSILTILLPLQLLGQMFPLSDQYLNNTMAFNPAFAGCNDALSITLMYRDQMTGFEGAPKNSSLSVHAPLKNNRIGLGLTYSSSSYGINREKSLTGNYSYRIEAGRGTLAMGLGFSATVLNAAWNELKAADAGDELLTETPVSAVLPDFSLGTYYYTKNYFLGISVPMILSHDFNYSTGKYSTQHDFSDYNWFFEGGYFIPMSKDIKILPSVLLKYQQGHAPQADMNAHIIFRDIFRLGIGYRTNKTLLAMLQLNINKQLMFAYSSNIAVGEMNKYSKLTHEVVFSYIFSYSRKVASPRQF